MDWTEIITTLALTALVPLVALAMNWLAKQKWAGDMERELFLAIEGGAQRAKDKYLEEIVFAKRPDSPGGVTVTAEEKSQARAMALNYVLQGLSGPALEYAKGKGETLLKGWIGGALDKILPGEETP